MKIITETIELSPEEFSILMKPEETKVPHVGNMGKSVVDVFKEAEFRRQQKECGTVKF